MVVSLSDIAANAVIREKIFSICDIDTVVDASEGAWITIDGARDFSTSPSMTTRSFGGDQIEALYLPISLATLTPALM